MSTLTPAVLRTWSLPEESGDKNASGRVLVVGGHRGMPGAVLLAAEAALRVGAGKIQVAAVDEAVVPLGVSLPEAFVAGLPATGTGELDPVGADMVLELAQRCDAVLLGPGFMDPQLAADFVQVVAPCLECALVIDALGTAFLTGNLDGLGEVAARTVLSPNSTELAETLEIELPENLGSEAGVQALTAAAGELAHRTGAVVLTGAATTLLATPDGEIWQDDTGAQGLAVSGSGDVKAGMVAGLLARGLEPLHAAAWAEHAHGRCGERLAADRGQRGYLARDILPLIPSVMVELEG